jgi:hypothetical protein
MFAIYVCLRPALVTLEPPQRLRLMRVPHPPDHQHQPAALGLIVVLIGASGRFWG